MVRRKNKTKLTDAKTIEYPHSLRPSILNGKFLFRIKEITAIAAVKILIQKINVRGSNLEIKKSMF